MLGLVFMVTELPLEWILLCDVGREWESFEQGLLPPGRLIAAAVWERARKNHAWTTGALPPP